LHENIKTVALNALEASKPSGIFFGTVLSASPLKIQVEQKMTLTAEFLVLSSLVRDFTASMAVDGQTKAFRVHLGLSAGERVILLRIQGGQQFLVLDRVRG
jgi:hypothetical protein